MFNSKVTWGDELTLALRRAGGLQPVAKQLREALGFLAPSRATLAKLQKVERPDLLTEEETFRAWLVLVAIGEDTERWGVLPVAVPGVFDVERYEKLMAMYRETQAGTQYDEYRDVHRRGLEPRTRCLVGNVVDIRTRRRKKPDIIPAYVDSTPYARPIPA